MIVNNINISSLNARLLTKDIQTASILIYDDWLRNASSPLYLGKQEQYKQIKLKLYIKNIDEESALTNISNLIKEFEKCTIKFDDLSYYYDCLIVTKGHERVTLGIYNLSIELKSGYAYKPVVIETMDHVTFKAINVPGNILSPAVVTITVPVDTISLTLTGFGADPITINNLKANMPVIVDGEACTVTQAGLNKFKDTDIWSFPVLLEGVNTITSSTANCTIIISYKPRFI